MSFLRTLICDGCLKTILEDVDIRTGSNPDEYLVKHRHLCKECQGEKHEFPSS